MPHNVRHCLYYYIQLHYSDFINKSKELTYFLSKLCYLSYFIVFSFVFSYNHL